jgi:membrane-associated phospholipid phosphatase
LTLFGIFLAVFLILWAVLYAARPLVRRVSGVLASFFARVSVRSSRIAHLNQRYGAYLPLALIVLGGALFTLWAGDAFIDLAESIHSNNPTVRNFDTFAHEWAISKRGPAATTFFEVMSQIGGPISLIAMLAVVSVILLISKRYSWFFYLAVTAGGEGLLNLALKQYFARARPDVAEMLRQAQGYSFPSGHAMGSTVVFGALSYLVVQTASNWRWKSAVIALTCTLIAAVAFSRVYLGVHWMTDIAAGVTVGALWLTTTTVGYETLRRIRRLRAPAAT